MQRLFSWTIYLAILVFICCGKTTGPDSSTDPGTNGTDTGSGSGTGTNTGSGSGSGSPGGCGSYNGHPVYKGSNGGCYYINRNGNKTYVSGSYCC